MVKLTGNVGGQSRTGPGQHRTQSAARSTADFTTTHWEPEGLTPVAPEDVAPSGGPRA